MGKKLLAAAVNVICVLAILFSLLAGWTVLSTPRGQAPIIFGWSFMTVLTGSMEPALAEDSFIVVREIQADEVREGDIITFYAQLGGQSGVINTHRVIQVLAEEGGPAFRTQGDANAMADPGRVTADQLVGRVVFSSPLLGKAVTAMRTPLVFLPLVLLPLLIIVITYAWRLVRMAKEEVAQARRELEEEARQNEEKR